MPCVNNDAYPTRPGRPSTSTTDEKFVMEHRPVTIREVAEDVGILVDSCHATFLDV